MDDKTLEEIDKLAKSLADTELTNEDELFETIKKSSKEQILKAMESMSDSEKDAVHTVLASRVEVINKSEYKEEKVMEKSYEECCKTAKSYMSKNMSKEEYMSKMEKAGYAKSMYMKAYDEYSESYMEKAVKMDSVAHPEASAMSEKVMVGKVDTKKEQDEEDEAMVPKTKEASQVRHQGGSGEDGAWNGQIIKSEQKELISDTLKLAKSMGITKDQLKEALEKSDNNFEAIQDVLCDRLAKSFEGDDIDESELEGVFKSLNNHAGMIKDYFTTDDNDFACDLLLSKARTTTRGGIQYYADGPNSGKIVGSIRGDGASARSIARARKRGKISDKGAREGIKTANQNKRETNSYKKVQEQGGARGKLGTGGADLNAIKRRAARKLSRQKASIGADREAASKKRNADIGNKTRDEQTAIFRENNKDSKDKRDSGRKKFKQLKTKQNKRDKESEKKDEVKKSIFWGEANDKIKQNIKHGQNCHYSVEDSILAQDAKQKETLAKSSFFYEHDEVINKSENHVDLNDIITKGEDITECQNLNKSYGAKPHGAYTVESFDISEIAATMGISKEEAQKIVGLEKSGDMEPYEAPETSQDMHDEEMTKDKLVKKKSEKKDKKMEKKKKDC